MIVDYYSVIPLKFELIFFHIRFEFQACWVSGNENICWVQIDYKKICFSETMMK